jgi:hypothetical protein
MDSLKVSGASMASMWGLITDIVPPLLMIIIAVLNIIYLYYKIKRIKE